MACRDRTAVFLKYRYHHGSLPPREAAALHHDRPRPRDAHPGCGLSLATQPPHDPRPRLWARLPA
jgi:hypothetical protein